MTLEQYIDNIDKRFRLGNATEHTFRGDLQQLLESLVPTIRATNEPKRQSCGAPDYILTKKDNLSRNIGIPVGFIEAKDIGDKDLDGTKKTGNKEQFDRYKASLNNLIFTDYLSFHLYRDGEFIIKISIGEVFPSSGGVSEGRGGIKPLSENFANFENLIKDFCSHIGQTIKSSKKLAEMMAGKARLLSDVIGKALTSDEEHQEDSTLKDQMLAFKDILIHDITPQGFADVYAQTIAYGMFAARLHDPTLATFSRQEAAELIPKSNPFLRKLFGYIAGPDIDDRIQWIVDSLTDIFLACNVEEILKNYGKSTKMEDPIIHFYETFLSEYDPKLRKARGVWYTPHPVVSFQVRAIDEILKTEFGLPQGLADTSKTKIKVNVQGKGVEQEVHKVQMLDPATGTGTYIAEVIKHIYKRFEGQQGIWSNYVENHLLPRLIGFELLMASYAMAHLQIDLLLKETGYKPALPQRLKIYLTNSLEESHPDTGTLFANWLSSEANEANHIKRDAPVMIVMGNPPYSGISSNNGEWISKLIEDYKYVDGVHFNERKHWLNDDYVKFIRFGQHFIEKNGSGVLAYINPHGFLDNPTFRGMRWNLLKTYDKIYTIDLHGNSKKKETAPDGSADVNVFDIMQGVSINIFVKTGKKKTNELGKIFHFDLYGKREMKYDFLTDHSLKNIDFNELAYNAPNYFFVPKNDEGRREYEKGFKPDELFITFNTGIVTGIDRLSIFQSKDELEDITHKILNAENPYIEYGIKDSRRTSKESRLEDLKEAKSKGIVKISYRPFDVNYMYLPDKNEYWINSPRIDVMQHFIKGENVGLAIGRQGVVTGSPYWDVFSITKNILDFNYFRRGGEVVFPLYLYPETTAQQTIDQSTERTPNLNTEIVKQLAEKLGLTFTNEKETTENTFAPIDILDYIYAVLHSPNYREKYKEFLKIDFPRVPYPKDLTTFRKLSNLGSQIRQIHLLESPKVEQYITQYPIDGDNVVTKPHFVNSPPPEGCPQDGVVNSHPLEGCPQDGVVNSHPLEGCPQDGVVNSSPLERCPTDGVENKEYFTIKNTKIYHNKITDLPYNPKLKEKAKALRYAKNLSEVLFWTQVHKGHFYKIDFDRQKIIGNYIVDFYVKKLGLVIEIDGSSHIGKETYDAQREDYLKSLGLKIFRIPVADVLQNMGKAMTDLEDYILENYGDIENPPRPTGTSPEEGNLGRVYINETQYFDNVPLVAWEFYIGGYQPGQKWLKDRKDRKLEFEDILHYQKIIVALSETYKIMKEIDTIEI